MGLTLASLGSIERELAGIESFIYPGVSLNCGEAIELMSGVDKYVSRSAREEITRVISGINEFKSVKGLDELVVVNLASTEPLIEMGHAHHDLEALERCIDDNGFESFRPSTIYAYAAIQSQSPYINFTPSTGALFPAMVKLAECNGVPIMGNDGKTGETLVKSTLAPMFKYRNLEVLSWEGFNILGNMDGKVLGSS